MTHTPQDIIRMAREATGLPIESGTPAAEKFERFAALVAAAEREACAKVAEDWDTAMTDKIAAAIRARGNT